MKSPEIKLLQIPKAELLKKLKTSAGTPYLGDSLSPRDARRLLMTASGDGLQIAGPPEIIERLNGILKRLGVKAGSNTP